MTGGEFVIFIFAWLICGVICGAITDTRQAGFAVGFAAGALVGPLGLIVAFLVSPKPELVAQSDRAAGKAKVCPRCAETVKAAAAVCRFCGHEFTAPADFGGAAVDSADGAAGAPDGRVLSNGERLFTLYLIGGSLLLITLFAVAF